MNNTLIVYYSLFKFTENLALEIKLNLDRNKTYGVTVKWMDHISAGIERVDK